MSGGYVCKVEAHPYVVTECRKAVNHCEDVASEEAGILQLGCGGAPMAPELVSTQRLDNQKAMARTYEVNFSKSPTISSRSVSEASLSET